MIKTAGFYLLDAPFGVTHSDKLKTPVVNILLPPADWLARKFTTKKVGFGFCGRSTGGLFR